MAQLITLLLLCLASLAYSNATASTIPPVTIPMAELPTDDLSDDRTDHRRRTPPRPVMLTVDFDTKSMTITSGIDTSPSPLSRRKNTKSYSPSPHTP